MRLSRVDKVDATPLMYACGFFSSSAPREIDVIIYLRVCVSRTTRVPKDHRSLPLPLSSLGSLSLALL